MTRRADIPWRTVTYLGVREGDVFSNLSLRPFGILQEDREVDFDNPRPLLETQILLCCSRDSEGSALVEDDLWSMEIRERTQCLLLIAALNTPDGGFTIDLRCQNPHCAEEMEIDLSLGDIVSLLKRGDDNFVHVEIDSERFFFRYPTGQDQLTWLNETFADEYAAISAMARTLIIGADVERFGELASQSTDWVRPVSKALESADPLVSFSVHTPCPSCGAEDIHHVDLGALALQQMQYTQDRLLETIHTLASRYHWSEEQILALPPWRRGRYLSFVNRDAMR